MLKKKKKLSDTQTLSSTLTLLRILLMRMKCNIHDQMQKVPMYYGFVFLLFQVKSIHLEKDGGMSSSLRFSSGRCDRFISRFFEVEYYDLTFLSSLVWMTYVVHVHTGMCVVHNGMLWWGKPIQICNSDDVIHYDGLHNVKHYKLVHVHVHYVHKYYVGNVLVHLEFWLQMCITTSF